jgi:hypothetical protein
LGVEGGQGLPRGYESSQKQRAPTRSKDPHPANAAMPSHPEQRLRARRRVCVWGSRVPPLCLAGGSGKVWMGECQRGGETRRATIFFAAARQVWGIKDRARGEFRASGRGSAARRQGVRVAEKKKRFCSSNKRYRPGGRIQGHLQPHYTPTRSPGAKTSGAPAGIFVAEGGALVSRGGSEKKKRFCSSNKRYRPSGPVSSPPPHK